MSLQEDITDILIKSENPDIQRLFLKGYKPVEVQLREGYLYFMIGAYGDRYPFAKGPSAMIAPHPAITPDTYMLTSTNVKLLSSDFRKILSKITNDRVRSRPWWVLEHPTKIPTTDIPVVLELTKYLAAHGFVSIRGKL